MPNCRFIQHTPTVYLHTFSMYAVIYCPTIAFTVAAREAKTESCKSDSVTVVKVVKADSKADIVDHKTSSGSSGSAQNGPKSSNLKSTAAASSKTNKDRAEAAAFLKV